MPSIMYRALTGSIFRVPVKMAYSFRSNGCAPAVLTKACTGGRVEFERGSRNELVVLHNCVGFDAVHFGSQQGVFP